MEVRKLLSLILMMKKVQVHTGKQANKIQRMIMLARVAHVFLIVAAL